MEQQEKQPGFFDSFKRAFTSTPPKKEDFDLQNITVTKGEAKQLVWSRTAKLKDLGAVLKREWKLVVICVALFLACIQLGVAGDGYTESAYQIPGGAVLTINHDNNGAFVYDGKQITPTQTIRHGFKYYDWVIIGIGLIMMIFVVRLMNKLNQNKAYDEALAAWQKTGDMPPPPRAPVDEPPTDVQPGN